MGPGLLLHSKVSNSPGVAASTLEACARQVSAEVTSTRVGDTFVVRVTLHPAAEAVELRVAPNGLATASASTSGVGPGYHQWLCEWLDEVAAALGAPWSDDGSADPTGYFSSRDRARLERAFFEWLGGVARLVVERVAAGMTGLAVSLPAGDVQYLAPGFALTPLGPRDEAWWKQAVAEASACTDVFPWWSPGRGAHELNGRARTLMWTEVCWRAPLTAREQRVQAEVLSLLARGYELEPRFTWPWREWLELLLLTGSPDSKLVTKVRAQAARATGPLVGYLRHDVRVALTGGWTLRVPGGFARAVEPDGVTLRLGDATRAIFVMTGSVDPDAKQAPPPKGTGERLERTVLKLDSAALVTPRDDGWQLVSNTVVPGAMAVVTVHFTEAERAWALETWRSIAHPAGRH